ncbi:MAG: hypothetical protein H7834_05720 [Magnetococcus sp. YQC-9]
MTMAHHPVLTPLRHNGVAYRPGDLVEMTPDGARVALRLGAIAPAPAETMDTTTALVDVVSIDPLLFAIAALDPHDPTLWTRDRKPRLEILSRLLARPIPAAERDMALKNLEK